MSVRLGDEVRARLERQAGLARERPATYAQRLIDEGLRAAAHPGIVFRSTPTGGRVAAVADGPDVAEIVRIVRGLESRGDERVGEAARWFDLPEHKVRLAIGYYAEFTPEIDEELRLRADAEQRVRAQLERQRDLLR
jgi:hypothetical protein